MVSQPGAFYRICWNLMRTPILKAKLKKNVGVMASPYPFTCWSYGFTVSLYMVAKTRVFLLQSPTVCNFHKDVKHARFLQVALIHNTD
jgi:hypothetical protein